MGYFPSYLIKKDKNRDIHSLFTRQASNLHLSISTLLSYHGIFYYMIIQDFNALPTTLKLQALDNLNICLKLV